MALEPLDLTGGKSVYCFNQSQLDRARRLAEAEDESGEKVRAMLASLQAEWSRNEQASLAMMIIEHLNTTPPKSG